MQYDGYTRTVDQVRTRYGGSEAVPRTPTDADPRSIVAQSVQARALLMRLLARRVDLVLQHERVTALLAEVP